MLVNLKQILSEAVEKKYAVGAFGGMDLLSVQSVINVAEKKNVPVILLCSQLTFKSGKEREAQIFFAAANAMMKEAKVPVTMILDHGNGYDACMKAIGYGFKSVMFDGSSLPIEENARITSEIVKVAHLAGVSVEAEIGHVGGLEANITEEGSVADKNLFTKPEDAKWFVEQTGVDALAVAIGSVHGVYKGTPELDLKRLDEIKAVVNGVPLVLHGGSGIPEQGFMDAVAHGICKVNIYTSMVLKAAKMVKDLIAEKEGKRVNFTEMITTGKAGLEHVVDHHIDIFGTKSLYLG